MIKKINPTPSWGKILSEKELIDLLARIEAKRKVRKDKEK